MNEITATEQELAERKALKELAAAADHGSKLLFQTAERWSTREAAALKFEMVQMKLEATPHNDYHVRIIVHANESGGPTYVMVPHEITGIEFLPKSIVCGLVRAVAAYLSEVSDAVGEAITAGE